MDFMIEKNVPIPLALRGGGRPAKWTAMEVGDSVFLPNALAHKVSNQTGQLKRKYGMRFTVRTLTEEGVKGVRAWRVA